MAGGYISCGSFMGADKSGSAFEGLLEAIAQSLPTEESRQFRDTVIRPVLDPGYSEEQTLIVPADVALLLRGPLRSYYDHLGEQLGYPLPLEAPDLDRKAGLDPVEAKWGKGLGWQHYCAHDLLQACLESRRSGEPVVLSFD
jgi:hypothetical protein